MATVNSTQVSRNLAMQDVDVAKAGPGGRSSISGVRATCFGATGFLGRYVVNQLGKIGSQVVIPNRCGENFYQHLQVMGDLGQIALQDFDDGTFLRDDATVTELLSRSNVVVNMVGRDFETFNYKWEELNVEFAERIARCARAAGVERLIHVSALGADAGSASRNLRTKAAGEAAVLAAFPDATIVRPAPLTGCEDRLLNNMALMTKNLPFLPLVEGGDTPMQPVYVTDVAEAIMATLETEAAKGATYELGGPKVYTYKQLVDLVQGIIREPSNSLPVPGALAKLFGRPREAVVGAIPFHIPTGQLFTSDYVEALLQEGARPFTVSEGALGFADLGMAPRPIDEGVPIEHVRFWRTGGYDFGSDAYVEGTGELKPPPKVEGGAW